jgi:UDP:flavonoid glycosyltransferase YjiC (YdhE family)
LLVTLGSFLGASQRDAWAETAQAVDELGVRALFVGPQVRGDDKGADTPRNILSVGFVPLSRVLNRVDAVVHHGGIGTTFGSLRAGRPAAVIPQGFDQPFNAVLVDRVGAGINAGGMGVGAAIERLLADPGLAARASALGSALVTTEVAAARTAEHIMHWAR